MSGNNQFSSDQLHEGLWGTQPIMDSTQINPSSRFQDLIVPDDHHQQPFFHQQGTRFHNPQNHQLLWLPTNFNTQETVSLSSYEALSLSNFHHKQQRAVEKENEQEEEEEEREYMFEKSLTPSDVGKLNRLVIPKQHAEKYLPLVGHNSLLSLEDESGKPWRFRYSYWNSSQSYVLTKGWSRFVKEKGLESGDIVAFERRQLDGERLFIRWRRRTATAVQDSELAQVVPNSTASWTQSFYSAHPYPSHPNHYHNHVHLVYQTPYLHAVESIAQNPTIPTAGNSRRLRLFGVNLDCQIDDEYEPSGSDCLSQGEAHIVYSTNSWSGLHRK